MSKATITRSAQRKPAPPKPPHKPTFPQREPAKVVGLPGTEPANHEVLRLKHKKTFGLLTWGIVFLIVAVTLMAREQIMAAYSYVRLEADERALAKLGAEYCTRPLLGIPEWKCTANELDCFTVPPESVIRFYEEQARAENKWRATQCLPLIQ